MLIATMIVEKSMDINGVISIAKDALGRGFDEVNFDYIRFPSDGDMKDIYFTWWKWDGNRNISS